MIFLIFMKLIQTVGQINYTKNEFENQLRENEKKSVLFH